MPKIISELTMLDLMAAKSSFEDYIKNRLGYESTKTVKIELEGGRIEITCSASDKFSEKLEYNERYKLLEWETANLDGNWNQLLMDMWARLERHLPRAARELQYSLQCLSKVTDSNLDIQSETARAVFADLKNMKSKLSEMLLEYKPEAKPLSDDEIPF